MPLRVMTYNILDGAVSREPYIREVLQASQPDIVVLQEVFQAEFVHELAQSLNMESFFASGNTQRQLALLSRWPIISRNSYHPFPPIHRTILEAEIEIAPNRHLSIFGIHILAFPGVLFELWRLWEIKAIINRIKLRAPTACLVLGDFNAIAPHDKVLIEGMPNYLKLMILLQGYRIGRFAIGAMLRAGFTDCFRHLHHQDDGFTLPPPQPNARLDYIFANDIMKMQLQECFVVREPMAVEKASDHYPVMAVFGSCVE
jgi:endonuclease/exonuclease/phosphatase family metal-dependent hydrolase